MELPLPQYGLSGGCPQRPEAYPRGAAYGAPLYDGQCARFWEKVYIGVQDKINRSPKPLRYVLAMLSR